MAVFQPRQHRLADMNAAVIDDVGFHYAVAVGFDDVGQSEAKQVVAHMTEVQGLVCVGRGVLNHHQR